MNTSREPDRYAGRRVPPDRPRGPTDRAALLQATAGRAEGKLPVEQVTVTIGGEIQPQWMGGQIKRLQSVGYERLSVYLEPWPEERFARVPRIADWARRILVARHAGADTVFVPQTWRLQRPEIVDPEDDQRMGSGLGVDRLAVPAKYPLPVHAALPGTRSTSIDAGVALTNVL